jgi:transposase
MGRFVVGAERDRTTLFPPCLKDWIAEDNPVRVVDAFVDALDLGALGFAGVDAARTGRPGYHPAALLKLYVYGYLNRVPSSRRLEREAGRNVEVMWLTGQLSPDHKTIAEFRRQNGPAIGRVCAGFIALCREIGLLTGTRVAIDGLEVQGGPVRRQFARHRGLQLVAQCTGLRGEMTPYAPSRGRALMRSR